MAISKEFVKSVACWITKSKPKDEKIVYIHEYRNRRKL